MDRDPDSSAAAHAFRTTRWSLVARAGAGERARYADQPLPDEQSARTALEQLCTSYWYPLYAHARRRGFAHHAAQDLVQGFFARLIETHDLSLADPARGRFRAFLLAALSNYMANELDREHAEKRGGGRARLSIDDEGAEQRFARELTSAASPEKEFERRWAREVLARARAVLAAEWARAGREALCKKLEPYLTGDAPDARQAELAQEFGMSANAVRIALHRLRKRYGELVRLEVADTLADERDVDAELGELFDALGD